MATAGPKGARPAHDTAPGGAWGPEQPTVGRARTNVKIPAHSEDEPKHERAVMEDDIALDDLQAPMQLSAKKKAAKKPALGGRSATACSLSTMQAGGC